MKEISDIVKPFEDWSDQESTYFGLCVKDGELYKPLPEDEEYDEWHIYKYGDGWIIECAYAENAMVDVYMGKIPNREFFVDLIKNVRYGFNIEEME